MSQLKYLMEAYKRADFIVLDTETTGLHEGEICQIAILAPDGSTVIDTLVKPVRPIPQDAIAIHGISNDMVANAPSWAHVSPKVEEALGGKDVLVYNALYDRRMMHQSAEAAALPKVDWKTISYWGCVMEAYAEYWGDWNAYRNSYRWQKLTAACQQQKITISDAHNAHGDALMTLALIRKMCEA